MTALRSLSLLSLALAGAAGCSGSHGSNLDAHEDPPGSASAASTTTFGGWTQVAGNTDVAMATTSYVDSIYLFIKGLDRGIYANKYTSGTWSGWSAVGGQTDAPLATTTCFDGLYLVQKGLDQKVYFNSRTTTTGWAGWQEVPGGGATNAGLSATCLGNGQGGLRIYMKGLDGKVYENVRVLNSSNSTWQSWTGWHEVGDGWVTNVPVASFETSSHGTPEVALLFTGTNDVNYYKVFKAAGYYTTSGTWGAWSGSMTGTTDVSLAGVGQYGRSMVVGKGINDRAGYFQFYVSDSDTWTGWESIGAGTTNAAYATTYLFQNAAPNTWYNGWYVFAKGINDNGIYMKTTATGPLGGGSSGGGSGGGSGSGSSGGGGGPKEAEYTTYLARQPVFSGPLPYAGYLPSSLPVKGGLGKWLLNSSGYAISIPKLGKDSASCFDASNSINLAPNQKTTAAQMTSIFGSATPSLPTAVVACVYANASPPASLPLTIDYTYLP